MTRRAVIGMDLDGVLVNWEGPMRQLLVAQGATIPDGPSTHWEWLRDHAGVACWDAAWDAIHADPAWWVQLPKHQNVTPRVLTLLDTLATEQHVLWVTHRPLGETTWAQTRLWLERRLGGAHPQVVLTQHDKASAYRALGCTHVVEDNAETASAAEYAGMRVYLVDRPYNRSCANLGVTRHPHTEAALEALYREVDV